MSSPQNDWKVLAVGHGGKHLDKAQQFINSLGLKNVRCLSLDNNQENDDRVLNALKEEDYDAIAIGKLFYYIP